MPGISFTDIVKEFSRSGPRAVDQLSFEVADGDFLCLLGPSGCGKTTTLRMLAGLEQPTSGRIAIGDRVVDDVRGGVFVPAEKRGLGMVFQSYALWPHLTVEQNVEFGLRLGGKNAKAARQERVTEAMERLSIERYRDRYPSELSGGQQQRVALARTLVTQPDVILMDEPLSNLDAKLRLEMRTELKRIHADTKATIVFVTHDQWEAMTLATTIAVMRDGVLQQVGSPDDIYARPRNRFVAEFVGNPPINMLEISSDANRVGTAMAEHVAKAEFESPGKVRSVGIRPESIRIARSPGDVPRGAFSSPVRVASILPTGGSWILELAAEERRIFAVTSEEPDQQEAAEAIMWVVSADLHLFGEDGERLPSMTEEA